MSTLIVVTSCATLATDHQAGPGADALVHATPPRPNVILSEEPWTFGSSGGVMIRTPSYRLFTTISSQSLRDQLPVFIESVGRQYRTAITPLSPPQNALDTYVMADRSQWERVVTQLLGSRSDLIASMSRAGFTLQSRSIVYDIGPHDTFVLLAHEGWHQFAQASFKEPLPIWLDEGLATWFEGHRWTGEIPVLTPRDNPVRLDVLTRAARTGSLIPLDQLTGTTPQDWITKGADNPLVYYAQAWSMARFLTEDPTRNEALATILTLASRGQLRTELSRRLGDRAAGIAMSRRLGPGVMEAFVDRDLSRLQSAYSEYVARITGE
ncbi:MAG: hypothetical protein IT432_07850 [Phycisphaerales bacterium]|nr:hypothetical protein [Phycisphaerales bacterium]